MAAPRAPRRQGLPAPALAALLLLACALPAHAAARGLLQSKDAGKDVKELHIVHINDVHNRIEETAPGASVCLDEQKAAGVCLGGWGRIATAVKGARKQAARENAGFLFLDAGDEFDGSLWDVVFKGAATAVMQNIAKPDAMTLGNHEFSFPADVLAKYISNLTFPVLGACNINTSKEPKLHNLVQRWDVRQFGKYKVALIGWITPDTVFTAANVGNVTFSDPLPSVKACIAEVKKAHPDLHMIIGMSHTGYEEDLAMAAAVPDLDLIIGGHSHTFLNTPNTTGPVFDKTKGATAANCLKERACDEPEGNFPTYVASKVCSGQGAQESAKCVTKNVPVVQAFFASKYLGHLKIDLATKKLIAARPVLLGGPNSTSPWPKDPEIMAAIKRLEGPVRALENRKSGLVDVTLIGGKPGRVKETNFGDYLASLLASTARALPNFEKAKGPVKIGFLNAGAIRADIEPPTVSYGEILTALPFLNTLAVKSLSGHELRDTIFHGLSGFHEAEGRFLQVSGLRAWHRGNTLLDLKLLNPDGSTSPIDPKARYNVATLDYLANGGDGFESMKAAPSLMALGNRIDELMFDDCSEAMPAPIVVPDPAKERRIIDCDASYVNCQDEGLYGPCCAGKKSA
ncbi:hypothetical protein Rsub_00706 [Raphidocelis subcapitata]|uniref:5'-nucleotidase n=1 Tax=Raphidocelis subcapitata TaxID=307507 RepID=A0A2V0NKV2_9CHLO|nr:hypothetical protein Rsub_00706 [Raphidocelis subcapitata]|eukprot:GBF87994.1 hypothetical protein Rsub_00706 [Raphidocelis subcapitata]